MQCAIIRNGTINCINRTKSKKKLAIEIITMNEEIKKKRNLIKR